MEIGEMNVGVERKGVLKKPEKKFLREGIAMVIADLNLKFYLWLFYGGGSWIRTNVEMNSADLQSAAIDHSAIPPTYE